MAKSTSSSRAHSVLGGHGSKSKSSSKGKHPHEVHIRRGKSGGFIVRHTHKPDADTGEMPEEEEHNVPDLDTLHDHIDSAMGDQGPAPMAAPSPDASAQAAPAGGPPAAAPAAPAGM